MIKNIIISFVLFCFAIEGVEMKKEKNTKIQDIMELICLSALHPDQINPMVTQTVEMSINSTKSEMKVEEVVAQVKKKMMSEEFLKKYSQPFDKIFTHEEITVLVNYYKSEALKKLYKTVAETFVPIYTSMQSLVSDIVQIPHVVDKLISLTEQNYQKEIKEFSGSALIEVYSTLCAPCKTLAPIFSEVSDEFADKVKFLKLNLSNESNLSKELQIHSVPTLLFVQNGKIISKHVGLITKSDLIAKIKGEFLD